jgi:hypothetical protein
MMMKMMVAEAVTVKIETNYLISLMRRLDCLDPAFAAGLTLGKSTVGSKIV